ncbi:hypothetical protein HDU92_001493 [Lobulomyces angularis]|nr:hypothetical protein HDU92_001493 [Lobulomyces angularis]
MNFENEANELLFQILIFDFLKKTEKKFENTINFFLYESNLNVEKIKLIKLKNVTFFSQNQDKNGQPSDNNQYLNLFFNFLNENFKNCNNACKSHNTEHTKVGDRLESEEEDLQRLQSQQQRLQISTGNLQSAAAQQPRHMHQQHITPTQNMTKQQNLNNSNQEFLNKQKVLQQQFEIQRKFQLQQEKLKQQEFNNNKVSDEKNETSNNSLYKPCNVEQQNPNTQALSFGSNQANNSNGLEPLFTSANEQMFFIQASLNELGFQNKDLHSLTKAEKLRVFTHLKQTQIFKQQKGLLNNNNAILNENLNVNFLNAGVGSPELKVKPLSSPPSNSGLPTTTEVNSPKLSGNCLPSPSNILSNNLPSPSNILSNDLPTSNVMLPYITFSQSMQNTPTTAMISSTTPASANNNNYNFQSQNQQMHQFQQQLSHTQIKNNSHNEPKKLKKTVSKKKLDIPQQQFKQQNNINQQSSQPPPPLIQHNISKKRSLNNTSLEHLEDFQQLQREKQNLVKKKFLLNNNNRNCGNVDTSNSTELNGLNLNVNVDPNLNFFQSPVSASASYLFQQPGIFQNQLPSHITQPSPQQQQQNNMALFSAGSTNSSLTNELSPVRNEDWPNLQGDHDVDIAAFDNYFNVHNQAASGGNMLPDATSFNLSSPQQQQNHFGNI